MEKRDRAGRLKQIVEILEKEQKFITTHQLVKLMNMKPSPHSRGIVYEAFRNEMITGCERVLKNGKVVYYWADRSVTTFHQAALEFHG